MLIDPLLVSLANKWLTNERKLARVKLVSHLNIAIYLNIVVYLNIIKYLNIARCILKNFKLRKKDKDLASFILLFYMFII